MAARLQVNPHYFPTVREEGYERFKRLMKKDDAWSEKNGSIELGFFASTWAPTGSADVLQFDEGHLKSDSTASHKAIATMTDIMNGTLRIVEHATMNPLSYLFQTVGDRVREGSSDSVYGRFKALHEHYFEGLILQVKDAEAGRLPKHPKRTRLSQVPDPHRWSLSGIPDQYGEGVDIPEHAYHHPSVQKIMHISAEIITLANDIASFKKDQLTGVNFNIIKVLQQTDGGLSVQQAMDKASVMLDDCYRRWYLALAEMPIWGEEKDSQVLRYIDICRNVALGCLHWSFMTERYLGKAQGEEVRRTRKLWLVGSRSGQYVATLDRERAEMASLYADIAR
ncbi:isoprenoid synthase domain-containing protein [Podospora fimiseda]|uniref:Terpene synthase n=1 Tax=Podospora fimiseda TaxID=252190 RepID=A0AAN7BSA7_9PEZI|nr:isoprenoid synthase domain-containing protein [Podospora fimiseda]